MTRGIGLFAGCRGDQRVDPHAGFYKPLACMVMALTMRQLPEASKDYRPMAPLCAEQR